MLPEVRRRIFFEPHVRFWWLAAAILTIGAVAYAISGLLDWRREVNLVEHGTVVQATINESGGAISHRPIAEDAAWDVKFTFNGTGYSLTGFPDVRSESHYNGDVIPIRIDPDDPTHWTNRQDPPSPASALFGIFIFLPVIIICLLLSYIRASGLRRAYVAGPAQWASAIKIGHSSLAPRSYLVSCVPADGQSRRIYHVYVPRNLLVQTGDLIPLVTKSSGSSLAFLMSEQLGSRG